MPIMITDQLRDNVISAHLAEMKTRNIADSYHISADTCRRIIHAYHAALDGDLPKLQRETRFSNSTYEWSKQFLPPSMAELTSAEAEPISSEAERQRRFDELTDKIQFLLVLGEHNMDCDTQKALWLFELIADTIKDEIRKFREANE